ncbi:hypothetical protein AQI88_28125 [Streptomyces cellostaticus]|uniref:Uncharacterized protein n=1 Tax=Streptomyces cellostaticus TaxID=67285 RepID=A0A101NHT6_9ACTN|nr:hypothetical protein [Streptomyces cellostaticus]KUM93242.1 hypothetical protein AQI88_28125 [Streptomyces cellostaticus]GHI09500.1 hypothetical protein Scel_78210 [Streptomyces cellostaticus]
MFDVMRKYAARFRTSPRAEEPSARDRRAHNLFEAAAAYVAACAEDDQDRIEEAAARVSPEALAFGVRELACRAVVTLARERDKSPRAVARDLLGLPTP